MPYISDEELRNLTAGQPQYSGDLGRLAAIQEMQAAQPVPIPLPVQKQEAPPDTTGMDVASGLAGTAVGTAMMFNPVTAPFAPLAGAAVSEGISATGRAAMGAGQDPAGATQSVGRAAAQSAGQYGAQQAGLKEKQALREQRRLEIEQQRMQIREEVRRVDAQRQAGQSIEPGLSSMVKNAPQRQEAAYTASASFNAPQDTSLSDPGSVMVAMQEALDGGTVPPERVGEMMRVLEDLRRRFPGMGSGSVRV